MVRRITTTAKLVGAARAEAARGRVSVFGEEVHLLEPHDSAELRIGTPLYGGLPRPPGALADPATEAEYGQVSADQDQRELPGHLD